MVNFVANTTVVGPLLPAALATAMDVVIATAANSNGLIVQYVKAGQNSEYTFAYVTTHTKS